jgi:hypothetical protein
MFTVASLVFIYDFFLSFFLQLWYLNELQQDSSSFFHQQLHREPWKD